MNQKHLKAAVGLVGLTLLAAPTLSRAQDSGELTGLWDVSIVSPIGVSPARMVIADQGGTLAGVLVGENGPSTISGNRTADGVTLNYSVTYENAPLLIVMKAPSAASTLEGSVDFGGLAEGTWTAKPATADGVNGAWVFSADDGSGAPTTGRLTLIETNGTVSGRLLVPSRGVDGVVKGTVADGALKLTAEATADGAPITVTMPGALKGEAIEGTFAVADLAGRWTATRP